MGFSKESRQNSHTLSVRGRPSVTQVHVLDPTCLYAPPADIPLPRWRELVVASWQAPMLEDC